MAAALAAAPRGARLRARHDELPPHLAALEDVSALVLGLGRRAVEPQLLAGAELPQRDEHGAWAGRERRTAVFEVLYLRDFEVSGAPSWTDGTLA